MIQTSLSALNSLTKGPTTSVPTPPPPSPITTPDSDNQLPMSPPTIIKKEKDVPPPMPITVPVTFMNSNELKVFKLTMNASLKVGKEFLQKHLVERNEFQLLLQFLKRKIVDLEIKK